MLKKLLDRLLEGRRRRDNYFIIETENNMSTFQIQRLEYFRNKYFKF